MNEVNYGWTWSVGQFDFVGNFAKFLKTLNAG